MDCYTLLLLASVVVTSSAWSAPFFTVHRPLRVTRYAPLPPFHRIPIPVRYERWQRPKRGEDEFDHDRDHDHDDHDHEDGGVTGPVHTFVKTDKNANYKWGVRHHVGKKYKS